MPNNGIKYTILYHGYYIDEFSCFSNLNRTTWKKVSEHQSYSNGVISELFEAKFLLEFLNKV